MKKVIKNSIITLLALTLAFALASCGNGSKNSAKITTDNVKDVMASVLPKAYDAYHNILFGGYKAEKQTDDVVKSYADCSYAPVSNSNFDTLQKIKDETLKYYTESYAKKNLFTAINGDTPVYKEFDGKLYVNIDGGGDGGYKYSSETAKLIKSDGGKYVVSVDCIDNYEVSYTATLTFVNDNGNMKIDEAEYAEK